MWLLSSYIWKELSLRRKSYYGRNFFCNSECRQSLNGSFWGPSWKLRTLSLTIRTICDQRPAWTIKYNDPAKCFCIRAASLKKLLFENLYWLGRRPALFFKLPNRSGIRLENSFWINVNVSYYQEIGLVCQLHISYLEVFFNTTRSMDISEEASWNRSKMFQKLVGQCHLSFLLLFGKGFLLATYHTLNQ